MSGNLGLVVLDQQKEQRYLTASVVLKPRLGTYRRRADGSARDLGILGTRFVEFYSKRAIALGHEATVS